MVIITGIHLQCVRREFTDILHIFIVFLKVILSRIYNFHFTGVFRFQATFIHVPPNVFNRPLLCHFILYLVITSYFPMPNP